MKAVCEQLWLMTVVQVVEFLWKMSLENSEIPVVPRDALNDREAWVFIFWTLDRELNMIQLRLC